MMIKAPPPEKSVNISIIECCGVGVPLTTVLQGFNRLKADLEALGCTVTIDIDGLPIDDITILEPETTTHDQL